MRILQRSHLVIGGVFLILFLLTGGYMFTQFPELYQGREEIRMMFRATHIYILMSALVNLMCGLALRGRSYARFVWLGKLASGLILLAPLLFFVAFMIEPPAYMIERPISFWGVVALLAGVVLHTLLSAIWLIEKTDG